MPTLRDLNGLPRPAAQEELLRCCGSRRWAEMMAAARPFPSEAELYATADRFWLALGKNDWMEAFSHHPRIGDKPKSGGWASDEQESTATAGDDTLEALAKGNGEYENKFGYVFLVCATGKSAPEMLDLLRARLENRPEAEIRIAIGEQSKITRLRLEKLLRS